MDRAAVRYHAAGAAATALTLGPVPDQRLGTTQGNKHKARCDVYHTFHPLTTSKWKCNICKRFQPPKTFTGRTGKSADTGVSGAMNVGRHHPRRRLFGVRGYAEWKDKIATPAYQEYNNGAFGIAELRKRLADNNTRILDRCQR